MEIKSIKPTAEVELTLPARKGPDGQPATVKLMVNFFSPETLRSKLDGLKDKPYFEAILEYLISAIVGWDFMRDGQPLECNEATKREVMFYLRTAPAQIAGEEKVQDFGTAVLRFASDDRNFLKN